MCRTLLLSCGVWLVSVISLEAAEPAMLPPAKIESLGRLPAPFEAENLPEYLVGASAYMRDPKPGEDTIVFGRTEFTIKESGVVFIQVSFGRDGNASGNWKPEARTLAQLQEEGWFHIGPCPWQPTEELLAKLCKADEVYRVRTKKYNGPLPIIPAKPVPASLLQTEAERLASSGPLSLADLQKLPDRDAEALDRRLWLKWLADGEYDKLEQSIAESRKALARYRGGSSRVVAFYEALGPVPQSDDRKEQDFLQRLEQLKAWQAAKPKSSAALIAQAASLLEYGWFARGSGFADTVTDADAQRMQERATAAQELLNQASKLSKPLDCGYYCQQIDVSLGLSEKPQKAWWQAALKRDPFCREVVSKMTRALLPRWFGEPGELEQFASDAAKATQAQAGDLHFATVATTLWNYHEDIFDVHPLEWQRVRQGFLDRGRLYPEATEFRNIFVQLAVLAGDFATAREQFDRIGSSPDLKLWGNREVYDAWKLHVAEDLQEGQQRQLIHAHQSPIMTLALSPDGKTVASVDYSDKLRMHELSSGKRRLTLPLEGIRAETVTLSSRSSLLGAALEKEPGVFLMNLVTGQSGILPQGQRVTKQISFAPDGERLAAADETGRITIFHLTDASILQDITSLTDRPVNQLVFAPVGELLAVGSNQGLIQIYKADTGKLVEEWNTGEAITITIAWSADGKRLAAADRVGAVRVFELPGHKLLAEWTAPIPFPSTLDFSPNGEQLAIGLCGRQYYGRLEHPLRVWTYQSQAEPKPLEGHKMGVRCLAFTADGKKLVTGSYDWTIREWEMTEED